MNESGDRGGFRVESMAELLAINHVFELEHPNTPTECEAWSLPDPRYKRGQSLDAKARATTTADLKPDPLDERGRTLPEE